MNADPNPPVLHTARLTLRRLTADDAPFIFELVNGHAFMRYIGDKGVRTLDDARGYIAKGPADSYARHGFGLLRTELTDSAVPIGICGLVRRETLADVDIGFAFLPQFCARGYAYEAASAVLAHAREVLKLPRVVAIVSPDNAGSIRLLGKLGLKHERTLRLTENAEPVQLFV